MRFQVGLEVGNTISGYSELVAALLQAFSYLKAFFDAGQTFNRRAVSFYSCSHTWFDYQAETEADAVIPSGGDSRR
jgi:hypothetical protein